MKIDFASKLRSLRIQGGISQKELSERLHVGAGLISLYETGTRYPSIDNLIKIAAYFHVSIDFLLEFQADATTNESKFLNIDITELSESQVETLLQMTVLMKNEFKRLGNPREL